MTRLRFASTLTNSSCDAFLGVVNLRVLAVLFHVCLAVVLPARLLGVFGEGAEQWIFETAYVLRQTLISGTSTLLAVGAGAALAARRTRSRRMGASPAAILFASTVACGAALGLLMRIAISGLRWSELGIHWAFLLFSWLLWVLIGMLGAGLYWLRHEADETAARLAVQRADRAHLEAQMTEAQLAALQAQIEPHFLFNTLANVKRLYEVEPQRGRTMLNSLIAYLRAALPTMREATSSVARELELVRSYLTILGMRMGERLRFSIEADAGALTAQLPPMVLATLVENAVKHGLSALPEGGEIAIRARAAGDRLLVEVADTGAGFTAFAGTGVGLANTRARLAARYGDEACLRLAENVPHGVRVAVELPLERTE